VVSKGFSRERCRVKYYLVFIGIMSSLAFAETHLTIAQQSALLGRMEEAPQEFKKDMTRWHRWVKGNNKVVTILASTSNVVSSVSWHFAQRVADDALGTNAKDEYVESPARTNVVRYGEISTNILSFGFDVNDMEHVIR